MVDSVTYLRKKGEGILNFFLQIFFFIQVEGVLVSTRCLFVY